MSIDVGDKVRVVSKKDEAHFADVGDEGEVMRVYFIGDYLVEFSSDYVQIINGCDLEKIGGKV